MVLLLVIFYCCFLCLYSVVEDLLEKDASTINDIDKQGNAALHLAAERGHTGTIKVIILNNLRFSVF